MFTTADLPTTLRPTSQHTCGNQACTWTGHAVATPEPQPAS